MVTFFLCIRILLSRFNDLYYYVTAAVIDPFESSLNLRVTFVIPPAHGLGRAESFLGNQTRKNLEYQNILS